MKERIGVFGGTFDPIHCGHLIAATDVLQQRNLDRVLFVVAKDPYQKTCGTSPDVRYNLVERAVRYLPWAHVSNMEIRRAGPTHTIDTLEALAQPGRELVLIIGQDQFDNRQTWHRWREIAQLATIHVMPRSIGISSTDIRQRIREGRSIRYMVPDCVELYIKEHQIYPKD